MTVQMRLAAYCLLLVLSAASGFGRTESSGVDEFVVSLSPVVAPEDLDPSRNCVGVVLSPDQVAFTSVCADYARCLRQKGTVELLDHEGYRAGQLLTVADNPLDALLLAQESESLLSYIGELDVDANFPVVAEKRHHQPGNYLEGVFYLLSPSESEAEKRPVRLQSLKSGGDRQFGTYRVMASRQENYPSGSPVVNEWGEIVCLLADGNVCEALGNEALFADDSSCTLSYFQCSNVTWDSCTSGKGTGHCTNEISQEQCRVIVVADMHNIEFPPLHCRSSAGCGAVYCPNNCTADTDECDCAAGWGFCELEKKEAMTPSGCIGRQGGSGRIDSRCHALGPSSGPTTSPNAFKSSPEFYASVIAAPAVVTVVVVSAAVIVAVAVVKMRRRAAYESL